MKDKDLKNESNDWQVKPIENCSNFAEVAHYIRFHSPENNPSLENVIYINEQGYFYLLRADRRVYKDLDSKGFLGMNMSAEEAHLYAKELRGEKQTWNKYLKSPDSDLMSVMRPDEIEMVRAADAQIDAFANMIEDKAGGSERVIVVRDDLGYETAIETLHHEKLHDLERLFRELAAEWFKQAPYADRMAEALRSDGYEENAIPYECIVALLNGEREKLGLTLEESTKAVSNYVRYISVHRGKDALEHFSKAYMYIGAEMQEPLMRMLEKYGRGTELPGSLKGVSVAPPRAQEADSNQYHRGRETGRSASAQSVETGAASIRDWGRRGSEGVYASTGKESEGQRADTGAPRGGGQSWRGAGIEEQADRIPRGSVVGRILPTINRQDAGLHADPGENLYKALKDIYTTATASPTSYNLWEYAIDRSDKALQQDKKYPHNPAESPIYPVMRLALETIAGTKDLTLYNQPSPRVNEASANRETGSFGRGLRLLMEWRERGSNVDRDAIRTIAKGVCKVIGQANPSHIQLGEQAAVIARVALTEVKTIRLQSNSHTKENSGPGGRMSPIGQKVLNDRMSLGKALTDKLTLGYLVEYLRGGGNGKSAANDSILEHITKQHNVVADIGGGRHAQVGWNENEGQYSVRIYETGLANQGEEGRRHIWSSDELKKPPYNSRLSEYGANREGQIISLAGLQQALKQFGIETHISRLALVASHAKAAVKDCLLSQKEAARVVEEYKEHGVPSPMIRAQELEHTLNLAKAQGLEHHVKNLEQAPALALSHTGPRQPGQGYSR